MTTTEPAEPASAEPTLPDAPGYRADRCTRAVHYYGFERFDADGVHVETIRVEYSRESLDDTDPWRARVSAIGRRKLKHGKGKPGLRIGVTTFAHAPGEYPEGWPAWAIMLAERHHPARPVNEDGTPGDPEGSYL